ncbi:MAG: galactokinase, partial [Limisphaerales bacterium]
MLTMTKPESGTLAVQKLFKEKFGYTPTHEIKAPGRLELIGNHTDYNQGLVMSLAVDKYIFIAASPRTDGKVELVSTAFAEKETFSISDLKKNPQNPWADYVKGVLEQLRKHHVHFGGFNAAIHGTVPMGAGMSSSAALEVATAMTIRKLFPFILTETASRKPAPGEDDAEVTRDEKLQLAKLCQRAENQYVGVQSGILDQISSLFGKEFHAIEIDCQSLNVEHVPLIGDIAILICNSGVKHSLVGGEYNELRDVCESAARKIGVKALRAVDPQMLKANKEKLTEREYQCAFHVVGEIQRVIAGAKALRSDDFAQFGQYMFQSHESSRDYFKNSTKELDLLVELARRHPATLGARLTGGGFGGATINLIK